MKRNERLIALIEVFKDGRLHRAEDLARRLGVSIRTIYRDMDTLAASGVPVEGERGLGYTVQAAITLPPLNLTEAELEALHMGLAAVGQAGDADARAAAQALSAKIDAVLPADPSSAAGSFGFAIGPFADAALGFRHMPAFRAAVRARQKLRLTLRDGTALTARPLKLDYWGRVWTCIVWSEEAGDFVSLRIDRIATLQVLPGLFVDEPGKRLADYTARQAASDRGE